MRIKYLRNDKYERAKPFNEFIEKEFPQLLTEEKPELNLVAGGDGSMLHAISATIDSQIPYLGKAMGTLNFLMNSFDNDYEIIQNILEDRIKLDVFESNTIAVYIDEKKIGEAVNDVILGHKVTDYLTFNISTESGQFHNFEVKGTGLCISTPIGSTALNYNNNGRILPIDSGLLSITGIVCNRYINDIVPFEEIKIKTSGTRVHLTSSHFEDLSEDNELVLKKGSRVQLAFLDRKEFLQRRVDIGHRFRK